MPQDDLAYVYKAITELLTQHSGIFQGLGLILFKAFATILVAWFGIKSALTSAQTGEPFPLANFAHLVLTISWGFAMITYYSDPIPGVGVSFPHLITDQAQYLANTINTSGFQTVRERIDELELGLAHPTSILDVVSLMRYLLINVANIIAQFAVFAVIAYGYAAMAVAVLVGPIFIPFFIVPEMEWLFWGWLRSFMQYAFYQVVAQAYVFVFGQMLIGSVDALQADGLSNERMSYLFVSLIVVLISFAYGLLKVPSLVNSLFTGCSGESAGVSWR